MYFSLDLIQEYQNIMENFQLDKWVDFGLHMIPVDL